MSRSTIVFALTGGKAANVSESWMQVVASPNGAKGLLTKARFMPQTNVTADASNNFDLSLEINGTELASEQTTSGDTGNLTAGTEIELALSGSLEISDGDLLTVKKTHANSGALCEGTVSIDVEWYRAA